MSQQYDVIILGGGAAGLACAVQLKRQRPDCQLLILEALPRIGKKILATGNGRCNLGHTPITLADYHGSIDPTPTFESSGDTLAFFESLGLLTRTDEAGRVYPLSNQATAVLDSLQLFLQAKQVPIFCHQSVTDIKPKQGGFSVTSTDTSAEKPQTCRFFARQVVVTTGGKSSPSLGSNGSGFLLVQPLGHQPTALNPALCPVPVAPMKALKGVRVQATCSAFVGQKLIKQEAGEVQFTEQALSGICIFNLARYQPDRIVLDLLPSYSLDQLTTLLYDIACKRKSHRPCDWFTGILPKAIATYLLKCVGISPEKPMTHLRGKQVFTTLATVIKQWEFPIMGQADFAKAQVTAGGIPATQVTTQLESIHQKGLFFAGEILDLDGDCGGYNLHFAWSSGRYVASTIATRLSR